MRFKTFLETLNEATKDQNIIEYLSDKVIKTMKDMVSNKDRYKQYRSPIGYLIPISKIINKEYTDKDSLLFNVIKGITLHFRKGSLESGNPFFEKSGKRLYGHASYSSGNVVTIPFFDEKSGEFFKGFWEHYKSVLVHELTHIFQRFNGLEQFKDVKTSDDYKTWLSHNHEQEAILNEVFSAIREFIKAEIDLLQRYRSQNIIRPYVMKNNKLQTLFSSEESFLKNIPSNYSEIFKEYLTMKKSSTKSHYSELGLTYPNVEKLFLKTSYAELKKEFKNVLPEKSLKSAKNSGKFSTDSDSLHESSERSHGKLLSVLHPNISFVKIFRARDAKGDEFLQDDYVTLSPKFAVEHAESNHVTSEEQQYVIRKSVLSSSVVEASNPGEYLYVGPKTHGEIVYKTLGPDEYEGEFPDLKTSRKLS